MAYANSWVLLQRCDQRRFHLFPSCASELAEIAVSDPWYPNEKVGERGESPIVARSSRSVEFIKAEVSGRYLFLERESASFLPRSQPNFRNTRSARWERFSALCSFEVAVFRLWCSNIGGRERLGSIVSAAKRALVGKLYRNSKAREWAPRRLR